MSGAYLAYPYDESDLPVKASAMQAAISESLIFVDQELGSRSGKWVLNEDDIYLEVTEGPDEPFLRGPFLHQDQLLAALNTMIISFVSANTGRSPINGEAITYEAATGNLIWGAPVYDASLDFQTTFNSMYLGSLN